jgi:hypothetical protein
MEIDFEKLTRVTIVDEDGRQFEKYHVIVEPSIQDDGRTLKLFLKNIKYKTEMIDAV